MMQNVRLGVVTGLFVSALVACVGGPGPLPGQQTDQERQGGSGQEPAQPSESSGSPGEQPSPGTVTGGSVTISASEFDRSCEEDGDCVAVFEGNVCESCTCPNTAIAMKDAQTYASKAAEAIKSCSGKRDEECAGCASTSVKCSAEKTCTIQ